jgi:hypothetical protein
VVQTYSANRLQVHQDQPLRTRVNHPVEPKADIAYRGVTSHGPDVVCQSSVEPLRSTTDIKITAVDSQIEIFIARRSGR